MSGMPIYEYKCNDCGKKFEAIILPQSPAPECPHCHGRKLEQLLSAFAVNSPERSQSNVQAAQKKFEQTELRDKKVADFEYMQHHDD
jgi:putative FmdB family regulatory protein